MRNLPQRYEDTHHLIFALPLPDDLRTNDQVGSAAEHQANGRY